MTFTAKLVICFIIILIPILAVFLMNLRHYSPVINSAIFVTLVIAFYIAGIILMKIRNNLQKIRTYAFKAASRDFTATIDLNSGDELQELAQNIKNIISFEEILLKIRQSADTLDQSYSMIKGATDKVYESINNQAASVEETTSSFEELTSTISEVARNSLETQEMAIQTKQKIHTSSNQIRDTITDIQVLSESATKIMEILKIINAITKQTGLLSLNAAIEAARAGTAGKGFAVVASEIRKLAERSADATKEISQLAEEIITKIKHATSKSEISVNALQTIETSIDNVVKVIEEIADATDQEAKGSEHIMDAVNYVNELTRHNTESADKIVESNRKLKTEVEKLHELVNQFKLSAENTEIVGLREVTSGKKAHFYETHL